MPITVNEGGVLYELNTVTSNEGGVLYDLDLVHSNEGGTLEEIFSSSLLPKYLTWSPMDKLETSNNGFSVWCTRWSSTSDLTMVRTSSDFKASGKLTIKPNLSGTYYPNDSSIHDYGIGVTVCMYIEAAGYWVKPHTYYFQKPSQTDIITVPLSGMKYHIEIQGYNIGSYAGSGTAYAFDFGFSKS